MLLNQAEARTKWCPMVRQPLPVTNGPSGITIGAAAGNVRQYGTERPLCVASSCAMWRWSGDGLTGYCGLAGIPPQVL